MTLSDVSLRSRQSQDFQVPDFERQNGTGVKVQSAPAKQVARSDGQNQWRVSGSQRPGTGGTNDLVIVSNQASEFLQALDQTIGETSAAEHASPKPPYIAKYIATGPEAGALAQAGLANAFVPAWQVQVQLALDRNGGSGDATTGFLAWSDLGFVLLKNPGLTAEQNQRFARLSLEMGIPVEKLPSRTAESVATDIETRQRFDSFLADYDTQLQNFLQDPTQKLHLRDGRRRYDLYFEPASGLVTSVTYKKSSWKNFASRVLSGAATMLRLSDPTSLLLNVAQKELQHVPVLGSISHIAAERAAGHYFIQTANYLEDLGKSDLGFRSYTALTAGHAAAGIASLPVTNPSQVLLQNIGSNLFASVSQEAANGRNS